MPYTNQSNIAKASARQRTVHHRANECSAEQETGRQRDGKRLFRMDMEFRISRGTLFNGLLFVL